jgi:hypothetical protein
MQVARPRGRSWPAVAAGAALLFGMVIPTPVQAAGFHGYSHAWEITGGNFTGMQVYRLDKAVTSQPSTGCSGHFQGSPVYQTMWLVLPGTGNFYELGTGHQCNDTFRYWYWGLSVNGAFTSLGWQDNITNGASHTFRMDRVTTGPSTYAIYYRVDGVTKRTFSTGAVVAANVDAGLESWCQGCGVDGYANTSLKYLKAGIWQLWAGRDGQQINDPPMCGHWGTDSIWWAGQEPTC